MNAPFDVRFHVLEVLRGEVAFNPGFNGTAVQSLFLVEPGGELTLLVLNPLLALLPGQAAMSGNLAISSAVGCIIANRLMK